MKICHVCYMIHKFNYVTKLKLFNLSRNKSCSYIGYLPYSVNLYIKIKYLYFFSTIC